MGLEVFFNDIPLHENMLVLGVERSILPPRSNFSKAVPSFHGEHYTGFKYGAKTITLKAFLEAESEAELQDSLANIADVLNVTAPQKLIVSDEPDRHVFAVPTGTTNVTLVAGANAEFNIQFICYDVYKYANEPEMFEADEKNIVTVTNSGSVEAYPVVNVGFTGTANFLQVTNYTGETVLIGQRPSVDKETAVGDQIVMRELCETMDNFQPAGNVIDSHGEVAGTVQVNTGGYGIICADFGSTYSKNWHGGAVRRNIGKNVKNFKFGLALYHDSRGDVKGIGATTKPPAATGTTAVSYVVDAKPCLIIRSGRGTSNKRLGSIPDGKTVSITDVSKGWGKVTYSGVTGYVSMEYLKKPAAKTTTPAAQAIQSTGDVYVRSGAGTKYKALTVAKKGTKATILGTSNGWYKVTVNGKTGWSSAKWWKKISSAKSRNIRAASAESKLGRIEVYGFDQNGNKLFRCLIADDTKYYEYTKPEIYIGNTKVLSDNKSTPAPKKKTTKDSSGKSVTTSVDSGRFGDWNEFTGDFFVTRTTNAKGQQVWTVEIHNKLNGKVIRTLKKSNLISSNYPTGDLNHIVVWFGQYQTEKVVEVMSVNHLQVTELAQKTTVKNVPLFENGDKLTIDFEKHEVTLNDIPYMKELDIGSEFFSVPTGDSQFILASDNEAPEIDVGLVNRWL